MSTRSTRKFLTFIAPFKLPGFVHTLPAGVYALDTEDEMVEGNTHTVFRRIATTLAVQHQGKIEHHSVRPEDLDLALQRDRDAGDRLREALDSAAASPGQRRKQWLPRWLRFFGV